MSQPSILYPNTPYMPSASATATDSYSGTDPNSILSAREDTYWRPANTTGTKIIWIDLGEVRLLDTIALVGEGLDGVTISVKTSTDDATYTDRLSSVTWAASVNCGWDEWGAASARYIKIYFSTFPSSMRLAWVCLSNKDLYPYLEKDFDAGNVSDAGKAMLSPSGLYLGNIQRRTMREFDINFGTISSTEMLILRDFSDRCVVTGNPWVFVPNADSSECYFCWQKNPKFSAPFKLGHYEVRPITVISRAG